MKILHISDLHIGKRYHEFSFIEDQKYILKQIVDLSVENNVDVILIAGDIYDKSVPIVEAVDVFDDFITSLSQKNITVIAISGNHDSPERIDFGSRIMMKNNVHIFGDFKGEIPHVTLKDEFGNCNFYAAPYLKPGVVNKRLKKTAQSFDECVNFALETVNIDENERNILIAHQFITAKNANSDQLEMPERCESETKTIGGSDNVDVSAFEKFDYVALGHIHGPQRIGRDLVRYSGSPLKYSLSECNHKKSAVLIEANDKNDIKYSLLPLTPLRDMYEIKCTMQELLTKTFYTKIPEESYVHITLTDESEIVDAIGKTREIYPNVIQLDFENQRTRENSKKSTLSSDDIKEKTSLELFEEFFKLQNNDVCMTDEQVKIFNELIRLE